MQEKKLFFFIGTEAELIKLFPVMQCLTRRNIPYTILASGQNDITRSTLMRELNGQTIALELSKEADIKKSALGLMQWFARTWFVARKKIPAQFSRQELRNGVMIVHGDTVSTVMGAMLGAGWGMTVAHIEAGLRSHNWLNPFPEEIDRVLTSHRVRLHFAPGDAAAANLKKAKGLVVNTGHNTILDSLAYSRQIPCRNPQVQELTEGEPYFVFVMHRQENLANKSLVEAMVKRVTGQAEKARCVMILHAPTRVTLQEMGLLAALQANSRVTLLDRVEYFDFMKLLQGALFVITDGGSNQEELAYMGKPCLIMRTHTERMDGLGENALLYEGKLETVDAFVGNYTAYSRPPVQAAQSPSESIADCLQQVREDVQK